MNWNGLDRIDEVPGMSEQDEVVFDEVREVLLRHGAADRFGLSLLHSHFDLQPGERLVEYVDLDARELTIKAEVVTEDDAEQLMPTSWRLDVEDEPISPVLLCWRRPGDQHHARRRPDV